MKLNTYFFLLWIGCVVGAFAVIPFAHNASLLTNGLLPQELTPSTILAMSLEGILGSAIFIFFGRNFAHRLGIRFLLLEKKVNLLQDLLKPGLVVGILCTILQITVDRLLPAAPFSLHFLITHTPPLYGLIGSINGAFNQEIFTQLFCLSGIALLLMKLFKQADKSTVIWPAIAITSLIFGLAHLPNFLHSISHAETPLIVLRVILLNFISGTLFGYIFWRKGLEAAMLAHCINDLGLYALMPLIMQL
jgi:membrane protease YdiL (CAAX protease family)